MHQAEYRNDPVTNPKSPRRRSVQRRVSAAIATGVATDKVLAPTGQTPALQIAKIVMPTAEERAERNALHAVLDPHSGETQGLTIPRGKSAPTRAGKRQVGWASSIKAGCGYTLCGAQPRRYSALAGMQNRHLLRLSTIYVHLHLYQGIIDTAAPRSLLSPF